MTASGTSLKTVAAEMARRIDRAAPDRPIQIMEVCGTHTMAIRRHGLQSLLPKRVSLISGPGCPVCVTPGGYIDAVIDLGRHQDIVICTFGDMLRVPGRSGTLEAERASGREIRVVTSPMDALKRAQARPGQRHLFLGIGFETTAPGVAAAILEAKQRGVANFQIASAHKTMPNALASLVEAPDLQLDGFICPGHVSAIIGELAYTFLAREHGRACVIAGFEPLDVLESVLWICSQLREGRPRVQNQYRRLVRPEGNRRALAVLEQVFEPEDSIWRGLGEIPGSGLKLRTRFAAHDIKTVFDWNPPPESEPRGCICGDILRGTAQPDQCPSFAIKCTPEQPLGACMVSSEGTCQVYYRYRTETS